MGLVGQVEPEDDAVDVIGELLFGRRLRLRVLLWASEQSHAFNQSEASRGIGYSSSGEVAKELERLVQLRMLTKYGRPSRVGPQNYRRTNHVGWEVAATARRMIDAVPSDPERSDVPLEVVGVGEGRGRPHETGESGS